MKLWTRLFVLMMLIGFANYLAVYAGQTTRVYGVFDNDKNATLVTVESVVDTLKSAEAGTTGSIDMHGYTQFATFLRVHEHEADTGNVLVSAQISVDGTNWITADTQTARTADSSFVQIEWTLPPGIYFRVTWAGVQAAGETTKVDNVYHVFQQ